MDDDDDDDDDQHEGDADVGYHSQGGPVHLPGYDRHGSAAIRPWCETPVSTIFGWKVELKSWKLGHGPES